MINLIVKVINLFALTIRSAFLVTSSIGQVIVTFLSALLSSVLSVFTSLFYFFQIVYEDNVLIFTEELPNIANNILSGCMEQWIFIQNCFTILSDSVYLKTSNICTTIVWISNAASTVIIEVLLLLKKTLLLFGDTIWFILTFIPVHVPIIIRAAFKRITDILVNSAIKTYMGLLRVTNFLTDVPLESFVGIISAIIIVRLCVHFRENIQEYSNHMYWTIKRKLLYVYHTVYNYFTDSEVRVIASMARGQDINELNAETVADSDNGDAADALCVICQERQKCVLILPCRHVCLCRDCCLRLYGYQRTCPICRTFIYHSVNIYL